MKNKLNTKLILLASLISTTTFATTINDIEVSNLKELPKEFILQNIPVSVGDKYSNKNLSDIYLSLVGTNLVRNVRVLPKEDKANDTVKLVIEVEEIENASAQLQNQLAIREASKRTELKVNKFNVVGLKNVDISDILANSRIKVGDFYTPITINETAQMILNTGYFKEVVPEVNVNAKNKTVDITLKVTENPIIKGVNLSGVTVFDVEKVKKIAGLEEGKVINAFNFNVEASPILNLYKQNGILTARIEKAEFTNDGIVNILITEGKVSEIEYKKRIELEDNKRLSEKKTKLKTKPYIFERMSYIKPGDLVTEQAINATIKEFYKTGLYSAIEPRITGDNNDINNRKVTFLVEERPTTSINGQVAYETKEGFTGGLTLSDKNFLGRQQEAAISANFGTRGNYDLSASFFDPWIKGTNRLQVGANVFFKRDKIKKKDIEKDYTFDSVTVPYQLGNILRQSQSYTYGGSVTIGKGIRKDLFISAKPRFFGIKAYNSEGMSSKDKGHPKTIIDYTLGSVILGVTYDTRDDAYIPKNGLFITGTAELGYIFREKSLTNKFLNERKKEIKEFYEEMNKQKLFNITKGTATGGAAPAPAPSTDPIVNKIDVDNTLLKDQSVTGEKTLSEFDKLIDAQTDKTKKAKLEELKRNAIDKYISDNKGKGNKGDIDKLSLDNDKQTLKPRPYYIFNVDARAYHKLIKDKNSMAYRLTLGYASKGTPETMLFHTSDGTTLRGYSDSLASILATATVENRTYINDYVQFVLFAEAGIHNRANGFYKDETKDGKYYGLPKYTGFKEMFTKDELKNNFKADIGLGLRLTTPLGVIRLDYAWPLVNKPKGGTTKKFDLGGKLSFGFGQTF